MQNRFSSWAPGVQFNEKTEGRKSRDTVLLKRSYNINLDGQVMLIILGGAGAETVQRDGTSVAPAPNLTYNLCRFVLKKGTGLFCY
jgi:hypothetical protein